MGLESVHKTVCHSLFWCVCVCRTVSVWDGKDGACLKYVVIPGSHSGIKVIC